MKGDGWWWFWIGVAVLLGVLVTALKASAFDLYPGFGFTTTTGAHLPVSIRVVTNRTEPVLFWASGNGSVVINGYTGFFADNFSLVQESWGWFDAYDLDVVFSDPGEYAVEYGFNDSQGNLLNFSWFWVNVTGSSVPVQGANWSLRGLTPLEAFCVQFPARCAPDVPVVTPKPVPVRNITIAPALPPQPRIAPLSVKASPSPAVVVVTVPVKPVAPVVVAPVQTGAWGGWRWLGAGLIGLAVAGGFWWLARRDL